MSLTLNDFRKKLTKTEGTIIVIGDTLPEEIAKFCKANNITITLYHGKYIAELFCAKSPS